MTEKLQYFSVLLSLLTVIVVIAACHGMCSFVVMQRNREMNGLKAEIVAAKTNEALATVEEAVNLIMGALWMQEILDGGSDNLYRRTMLARQMEAYLSEKLIFDNHIDTVLLTGTDYSHTIYNNTINTYYGLEDTEWYSGVLDSMEQDSSDYFLFPYADEYRSNENREKICIIYPERSEDGEEIRCCLILFLNNDFVKNLTFTDTSVFLEDQHGKRFAVMEEMEKYKTGRSIAESKTLNIGGWNVITRFSLRDIRSSLNKNLIFAILLGLVIVFTAWIASKIFGNRLMKPVYALSGQLKGIREVSGEEKQIIAGGSGSLRSRISTYFTMLILFSITPVVIFFYYASNRIINESIGSSVEFNVNNIMEQAEIISREYESIIKEIAVNDQVQAYMDGSGEENKQGLLKDELSSCQIRYDDIVNIAFFDTTGRLLTSTFYSNELLDKSGCSSDITYTLAHYGKPLFRIVTSKIMNRECIRLGLQVINVNPISRGTNIKGVILIDFDAGKLMECISGLENFRNVMCRYVDGEGTDLFEVIPGSGFFHGETKGDYFFYEGDTQTNGWHFVVAVPRREYMLHKYQLGYMSILLFSLLLGVGFAFSQVFRRLIDRNIKELLRVTDEVKNGNLLTRFYGKKEDELGELGEQFNRMLERLRIIMDEKLATEIREKDAVIKVKELELELLQAQIKPHFLYNTLRAIEAMVILNDASAVRMIELLIKLFRTGISRGKAIVTLEEELEHVRAYSQLEQIRYDNKFEVLYEIPEDLLKARVLKLTLQPLVENAMLHGVLGKKNGGRIIIRAERKNETLVISVYDNGIGMNAEKVEEIRKVLNEESRNEGIGLYNVNARIKLKFGDEFGILVDSRKNEGTCVRVRYPYYSCGQ